MTGKEINAMMAKAKDLFRKGEPLFGKNGAFHFMLANFLNSALEAQMEGPLAENTGNGRKDRRNGKMKKIVQSKYGPIEVVTPRDRDGSSGQSSRDISNFIEENYGSSISAETISRITDKIWPEIQSWRNRSLEDVYPFVWLDAILYKVKDEKGATVTCAIYNVLGVDRYGFKDLLGMFVSQSEGANFWLDVLTDLKNR